MRFVAILHIKWFEIYKKDASYMYAVQTEYAKFKSIAYIFRDTKLSAHLQLSIFVIW